MSVNVTKKSNKLMQYFKNRIDTEMRLLSFVACPEISQK